MLLPRCTFLMCALFYYRRHLSQSLKTPLYPPLCLMDTNMFLYEKRKQGESNKKPQDAVTQCWLFIAQRWAQERVVLCQDDSRSSDHALEESVHKKMWSSGGPVWETIFCVHLLHMYCKETDPGKHCASKQVYRDGTEEAKLWLVPETCHKYF